MKWHIPVEYITTAELEIEAPTLDIAIDAAENIEEIPLANIDEQWVEITCGKDYLRNEYNEGTPDEPIHPFFRFDVGEKVLWRLSSFGEWRSGEISDLHIRDGIRGYRIFDSKENRKMPFIISESDIKKEKLPSIANISSII